MTKEERLEEFLHNHKEQYSKDVYEYILYNYEMFLSCPWRCPDVVLQLFSKFDILPKKNDFYEHTCNKLETIFGIDKNLTEVASGFYPRLAEIIDNKQKSGTITIYDPLVVINKLGKAKIIKDEFSTKTNISNSSLIIATAPCESTLTIIEKANADKKEFFIALCGCNHMQNDCISPYSYSFEDWNDKVYSFAKTTMEDDAELHVDHYPIDVEYPYPIIYKKKK